MMDGDLYAERDNYGFRGLFLTQNDAGEPILFSDNMRFDLRKSTDSLISIRVRKEANGSSFANARERAANISYGYVTDGSTLLLDNYLTTGADNKMRDQEVRASIYVPEGMVVQFDENTRRHMSRTTRYDKDLYRSEIVDYTWAMQANGELKCLNCPEGLDRDEDDGEGRIIINEEGVDIDIQDNGDSFEMKIDEEGVRIKTKEE